MNKIPRRSFLKTALGATALGLAHGFQPSARAMPAGANSAVRLGVIGLGIKGTLLLRDLLAREDVRVTALCDVDPEVLARARAIVTEFHLDPSSTTDPRELLARNDVDAVVIATGNHWHALLAVWACQAGKDAYVEKPMSRTVWEGRKIVEAAERYGRIVEVGMQFASDPGLAEAAHYIQSGQLGRIRHVHALVFRPRESIGRRLPWYPENLNYDMFCGPTPVVPLERDQLHYDWHWSWNTGNGDLGNLGVHQLGIALRLVGHNAMPRRVIGLGGRYVIDDAADTPNTMVAAFDYPEAPILFEMRELPAEPGAAHMDNLLGIRMGAIVHCEQGYLTARIGARAYDLTGKLLQRFSGDGGAEHMGNFLRAVRSRRAEDLAGTAAYGHLSAALCHFGNISYRVGMPDPTMAAAQESLASFDAARESLSGIEKHLSRHHLDLARTPLTVGPWIEVDETGDGIASLGSRPEADLARARFLLRDSQRPPYLIPESV